MRSDRIPGDILQRSYSNPNFFSSAHSEKHTSQNLQENNLDTPAIESPTRLLNKATHALTISHNQPGCNVNQPAKEDEPEIFQKHHEITNRLSF